MVYTLGYEQAVQQMSSGQLIAVISIAGGLLVGGIAVALGILYATVRKREVERTKREVAAYVAEGTISAQDAKVLLEAGNNTVDWAAMGVAQKK